MQEWELLSYDRWDPNKKTERRKCLDWDETISDALRKEFGLVRHGSESLKEALDRKLMHAFMPTRNGPKHDFSVLAVQVSAVVKSAMQKSMDELTEEEQKHVSTTAASSVSAVSGGSTVDTSNLSPESRGTVENIARSLARK